MVLLVVAIDRFHCIYHFHITEGQRICTDSYDLLIIKGQCICASIYDLLITKGRLICADMCDLIIAEGQHVLRYFLFPVLDLFLGLDTNSKQTYPLSIAVVQFCFGVFHCQ